MGLLGALFAGVSGLDSQSNAIGIVSNNISNVNTVGYKQGAASFDTLVVPSGSTSFSPGGVIGTNQQLIDQQGLIEATSSATDIAITGGGLMVVSTEAATGQGSILYTRAGSFTQDADGNFVNANGYYLQGLPILPSGGNSAGRRLETVNVSSSATGTATPTSVVNMAANLNSQQAILPGSSATGSMLSINGTEATNVGIAGSTIIAGNDYGAAPTSGLVRGDTLTIVSAGSLTTTDTFTYGGYTVGRDVTNGDVGDGDNTLLTQTVNNGLTSFGAAPAATTTTSAIDGINVTSLVATGAGTGDPFGPGGFTAGNFTVGGITVTLAGTETLPQIASAIQTAVAAVHAGSTATVSGGPGNYSITVNEASTAAGAAVITGPAVTTGTPTFAIEPPIQSPLADQMQITVGGSAAGNVASGNVKDYTVGSYVNVSGATDFGGLSVNGEFQVASINAAAGTITVTTTGAATSAVVGSGGTTVTVTNRTDDFGGFILNASTASNDFITTGGGSTADFASDALKFSVTVGSGTPLTFTYSANPNAADGQFSDLNNLATAINDSSNSTLTATVVQGRLYVSAANANESVTFTNGDVAGSGGLPGVNWVQELDLQNQAGGTTDVFNSLNGLAQQVNTVDPTNLTAVVNNPAAAASITITEANPEQTITFANGAVGGGILQELGFAGITPTGAGGVETTGTLNITYSPTSDTTDMSSGAVTPQQTFNITVYDSQGFAHTLALNLVKIAVNTWAAELTAVPASDVGDTLTGDGQLASGTIVFNGDGTLDTVTGSIADTTPGIPIQWVTGANPSTIVLNLAKSAAANGVTQDSAGYSLQTASQNGSPVGQLTGVSVDSSGYVIASFSNGQTQKEFQIPLANIPNPDGLTGVTGNAYSVTLASGNPTLQLAGTSGVGTFTPSALEESNVDLSTQLTDLIVAQQAYGANSKVLTIADQLLQELDQVIQ